MITRRQRTPSMFAAAMLLVFAATPLRAQDQVELWGSWASWSGKDVEHMKPGTTLGAAYIADIRWWLDVGGDIGFGRFGYQVNPDRKEDLAEFQVSTVFRRWLSKRARVQPFLGARLGYTRLSIDLTDVRLEQNGVLVGPLAGIVIPTGNRLSPTISFEALRQGYGDTRVFLEGQEIPETGTSSWRFVVKAGLTFGSGWKRKSR